MYKQTIGIVGGFGAYATLNFYKSLLEAFKSDSERNYPRILMDNDFTMPSRTRALLYGEEEETIARMIADSIEHLIHAGADKIILVCGTAHYFLPKVYELVPQAKDKVIHLIELLADRIATDGDEVKDVALIAAEGTLKQSVYDKILIQKGIRVVKPEEEEYPRVRKFIECIKQNTLSYDDMEDFLVFLDQLLPDEKKKQVILGCTEFPVLVEALRGEKVFEERMKHIEFFDPLEMVIDELKKILV